MRSKLAVLVRLNLYNFLLRIDQCLPERRPHSLLIDKLHSKCEQGASLVIHCRAGIGRAGLLAAAILTQEGCSPAQAVSLVSHCRGCAVPDTSEQEAWIYKLAESF